MIDRQIAREIFDGLRADMGWPGFDIEAWARDNARDASPIVLGELDRLIRQCGPIEREQLFDRAAEIERISLEIHGIRSNTTCFVSK